MKNLEKLLDQIVNKASKEQAYEDYLKKEIDNYQISIRQKMAAYPEVTQLEFDHIERHVHIFPYMTARYKLMCDNHGSAENFWYLARWTNVKVSGQGFDDRWIWRWETIKPYISEETLKIFRYLINQ